MTLVAPVLPPCVEFIDGQRFAWVERTPRLRSMIGHAVEALDIALASRALGYRIDRSEALTVSPRTALIPDLLIVVDDRPQIVVEYRSESTDRYVLGPKRLVYGRAPVPEFWFVDPHLGIVLQMLHKPPNIDYEWPPRSYTVDDSIVSAAISGLKIAVRDLLLWSVQ
jgi:Uma2 family endonuclease